MAASPFGQLLLGQPATGLVLKGGGTHSTWRGGFTSPLAVQYASISSGSIDSAENSTFGTTPTCWELEPSGAERSQRDLVEDFLFEAWSFLLKKKERKKKEEKEENFFKGREECKGSYVGEDLWKWESKKFENLLQLLIGNKIQYSSSDFQTVDSI